MIFMALAYSQFTSNTTYLTQHYKMLKQWAWYLIEYGLIPARQGRPARVVAETSLDG
jgi:Glutaminase A six helical-hairpin domain